MSILIDSIGSEDFIRLVGAPQIAGLETEEITRPGMDGRAFRVLAYRGSPFELQGVVDTNAPDVSISNYLALKGTIVNLLVSGIEYDDFLVQDVVPQMPEFRASPNGGLVAGSWILRSNWKLVYAGL